MTTTDEERDEDGGGTEESSTPPRRSFLKAALALALVSVLGGIGAIAKSLVSPDATPPTPGSSSSGAASTAALSFPKVKVANIGDLSMGKPVTFNYPLDETPNLLVKLGTKADGGVGPDGDIVAFSQVCQHLGCIYGYVGAASSPSCDDTYSAPKPVGYCCCHGSVFDLAAGATVLEGPSDRPQPQVILELDSSTGDIYAKGMTSPTIFGHHTGSDNVFFDLQGGTLVS
jgi:arsenite oxidase small subunit